MQKAHNEWVERMNGRVYKSLLPEDMTPPVHLNEDVMEKYK